MIVVTLLYLLNGLMYTVTVYCVLLMLEKAGKRGTGSTIQRIDLAARWAVGFTLLQLCADTIKFMS